MRSTCNQCETAFDYRSRGRERLFCSRSCSDIYWHLRGRKPHEPVEEVSCVVCSKQWKPAHSNREARFCSPTCAAKGTNASARIRTPEAKEKADNAKRSKGSKGYVKRGGKHEHRKVVEEELGRPLRSDEIVHHDDENKQNNDPTNLILTNRADHLREHLQRYRQRRRAA